MTGRSMCAVLLRLNIFISLGTFLPPRDQEQKCCRLSTVSLCQTKETNSIIQVCHPYCLPCNAHTACEDVPNANCLFE